MRRNPASVVAASAVVAADGVYAAALPTVAATIPAVLPTQFTSDTGGGDAAHLYVIGRNLSTVLGNVKAGGIFANWPVGSNPLSAVPERVHRRPGQRRLRHRAGATRSLQAHQAMAGTLVLRPHQRRRPDLQLHRWCPAHQQPVRRCHRSRHRQRCPPSRSPPATKAQHNYSS